MTTDPARHHHSDMFEHTISGLLTKRADLFGEAAKLGDRLAIITDDVAALDRVLGCERDLQAAMPRPKRDVVSGWGKLTRGIADTLRDAQAPMTARDVAEVMFPTANADCKLVSAHD